MLVHLIDDDEAARDATAFLLSAAGFDTRTYETAKVFLAKLPSAERGVIVTDLHMPEISGLELLRRLKGQGWPVIVITGSGELSAAIETLKEGARSLIEKPFDDEELLSEIRLAFAEGANSSDQKDVDAINDRLNKLSPTENRVARALPSGKSNGAIAQELGMPVRQVEVHRANILTKMQAKSLSHLLIMMIATSR